MMSDVLQTPLQTLINETRRGGPKDADVDLLDAFAAMVVREFLLFLPHMPRERAAAALRDRSPRMAAASLFAEIALQTAITGTYNPMAEALAAGARLKTQLVSRAGGALSSEEVAANLGIKRQAVDKRRKTRKLLGVPTPSGDWVYPARQFRQDGQPLDGLPELLAAFGVSDPWMQLQHLLVPDPDLGGNSILGLLRERGLTAMPDLLTTVRAAGPDGEHDGPVDANR